MSDLGRDGWPSDATVIRNRDREIARLTAENAVLRNELSAARGDNNRMTAENEAPRDITFPPFGHEFTVPTDKMDAEFLEWIRRNCLIVTEAHYTALRKDAERYGWLVSQGDPIIWDYLGGMDDDQIDEAIDKWLADDAHFGRGA